jgi:NitT/TauT family transport system substrate-binding protein
LRVSRSAFVLATVLGGALAGSGAGGAQTPELVKLNVGTPGQQGNAGVYYAQEMGFFKKAGLEVTISTLRKGSGAGVVAAVTGGSLDVGEADLMSSAAARAHGIKISFIAPSAFWTNAAPTAGIIVAKTSPIHTAKDFAGKTIGVPSLSGISRVATNAWLEQGGADLAAVKFVEIPSDSATAAVARGTIDAAVLTEPTLSNALNDNHIIGSPLDAIAKQYIETGWFASDDWIAKNPQTTAKFAIAIRDAQRWANANPGPAAAIFEKYSGVTAESLKNTVHTRYGDVLSAALMQPVLDAAFKYHAIAQPMPAKELISSAVASLAR